MIYELKMTGGFKDEKPPIIDLWKEHRELDLRHFD